MFNETNSNFTVFGFPEAELSSELFEDLPEMNELPTHVPRVITEDPATFSSKEEATMTDVEEKTIAELVVFNFHKHFYFC